MLLCIENINVYYGNIQALHDVSLTVAKGEIVSLIGANGAGKSTILKAVSGILTPRSGRILLADKDLVGVSPHRIVRMGVSLVPEGRGIFANMTVRDNLEMGAFTRNSREEIEKSVAEVFSLFPQLRERASQSAGTLSGGEQQMLAIGRAMVAKPDVVLLDEPSMGLSPLLVRDIFLLIREINRAGTTILLVEQNAFMALSVAHRAYVLETGAIALTGIASELRQNAKVRAAYLGDVAE
ncbi:MAG: ABC transporter ATP-binding protein [Deltaproteobacteria bacterium]|jgi:branched-chain amino acid transport system ATP-binding protein|nr:ABC transporter ATP-binding protein [Deltaproteobacteria bacterium]